MFQKPPPRLNSAENRVSLEVSQSCRIAREKKRAYPIGLGNGCISNASDPARERSFVQRMLNWLRGGQHSYSRHAASSSDSNPSIKGRGFGGQRRGWIVSRYSGTKQQPLVQKSRFHSSTWLSGNQRVAAGGPSNCALANEIVVMRVEELQYEVLNERIC